LTLSGGAGGGDAKNAEAFAFLDEDYDAQIFCFPVGFEFDLLSGDERGGVLGLNGSDFVQRPNNGRMLHGFAGVFTGFDGGLEVGFGNCDPDIGRLLEGSSGEIAEMDFDAGGVWFRGGFRGDGNLSFWMLEGLLDGGLGFAGVRADELGLAVDNHLRSERGLAFEMGDVLLLANGPIGRGIGIDPAIVVPIVDMFFEGDDFRAGNGLEGCELAEEGVGWGASRAAFGSEKLDENGSALGWGGGGLRRGGEMWIYR